MRVQSQPNSSALLAKLKGTKFFLQFQIARVNTAKGVSLGAADTVAHQLGKVIKVGSLDPISLTVVADGAR